MQRRNGLIPSWITLILEVCQKARSKNTALSQSFFCVDNPPLPKKEIVLPAT